MDGNRQFPYDMETLSNGERPVPDRITTEQLQHLVRLLDSSDVSEIEVKRLNEGTRLVLRKARVPESNELQMVAAVDTTATSVSPVETKHTIVAPLVGIFHTWAKPKGGALVAVGDRIKIGQLVGTIQSLNVINEVESAVAGRVSEILVQDGQAVEYGQQLMTIETSEEE